MATLSLKISVAEKNVVKTMQFEPSLMVYDACRQIRDKITEANLGQGIKYFIFYFFLTNQIMYLYYTKYNIKYN